MQLKSLNFDLKTDYNSGMDLPTNDCDGTNHIPSLNFVLSETIETEGINDGESNMMVPLVFSADIDLLKNINGMQVVLIDSSQVGFVPQSSASIITSTLVDESNQDVPLTDENPPDAAAVLGSSMVQELLTCSECGSTFKKSAELRKHVLLHRRKKIYQCLKCSESFNVERNLKLHTALHGNMTTTCPECGKHFSRFASFKAHILLHIEDDTLPCPHCDNEFETSRALNRHLEEEHGFETTLKNKASNMTLTELNSPLSHQQNFRNDSPPSIKSHLCKQCPQQFDTFRALKDHSRLHKKVNSILSCKKKSARNKVAPGTPPRYQCAHCSMSFDKPSMKARHERVHTGERPFKCDQCHRGFSQKNSLICHQKAIHVREKPYTCTLCPYASSQKGNLRAHVRRLHLPVRECSNVYRCDDCSAVFRSVSSLTAHMTKFHGDPTLLADPALSELLLLNKQYSASSSVPQPAASAESHGIQALDAANKDSDILQEALERSGLPVTADNQTNDQEANDSSRLIEKASYMTVVDRANANPMSYKVKYKIVDMVRWLLCPHCIKQFKKPLDMVRHLRIHNSIKPFKCHICQKIFRLKSTLLAHVNSHSGTKDYECPVCKKKLASRASLVLHQKLHTGHRPHTCPYCSKQFRHRSYFKVHVQAHQRSLKASGKVSALPTPAAAEAASGTVVKVSEPSAGVVFAEPFEVTDSGVFQRQPLNAQLFARTDKTSNSAPGANALPVRPYKCAQCGAGFKKSAHLKQHHRTHTGEKPFTCTVCLRNFVSKGVLRAHNRTHQQNQNRNFQCTECGRFFSTKGTLNRHMSSHSESRPFLCPYCQKSFKTYSVCKKHVTTHRNEVLHMQQTLTNSSVAENEPPLVSAPTESPSINEPVPMESNWEMPLEYESSMPTEEAPPSDDPEMRSMEKNDAQLNLASLHLEVNPPPSVVDKETHQYDLPLGVDFASDTITDTTAADTPLYEAQVLSQPFPFQENEALPPDPSPESEDPKRDPRKCTECGREFKRASHLKSHMRTHTGIKPFSCDTCGKTFTSKHILTSHQKTHVDKEAKSKSPAVLQDHMQQTAQQTIQQGASLITRKEADDSASVEDQFLATAAPELQDSSKASAADPGAKTPAASLRECPQCSKSFKKPSDLVRHMRIHTGEKPFTCNTCDKSFSLKSTLTAHMRTHQPCNKAFSCELCNGLFSCRNTLRIHMRIHTGVKPFKCPECHLCFRTTGHRQSHLKSHRKASLTAAAASQSDVSQSNSIAAVTKRKVAPKILKEQMQPQVTAGVPEVDNDWLNNGARIMVINDSNTLIPPNDALPTLVADQMGTMTNLTVKFLVDETGNVQLTQLDSSQLLDFSELFPNQADGVQGITLTPSELNLHLLTVPERQTSSPNQQHQELSKNLMNSDSGLRLLASNPEASLLVSGSQLSLPHHHEAEESVNIMLEAVDPSVVLGSQDANPERMSVIHTSRNRNHFNTNKK